MWGSFSPPGGPRSQTPQPRLPRRPRSNGRGQKCSCGTARLRRVCLWEPGRGGTFSKHLWEGNSQPCWPREDRRRGGRGGRKEGLRCGVDGVGMTQSLTFPPWCPSREARFDVHWLSWQVANSKDDRPNLARSNLSIADPQLSLIMGGGRG